MAKFNADAYKKLLESKIKETIPKVLEEDVAPTIKEAVQYEVLKDVYSTYSAKVYEARMYEGGLVDEKYIQTNVDGMRITASITTPPNESLFGTKFTNDPMLIDWMDECRIAKLPGVSNAPWINKRRNIKQTITKGLFSSYFIAQLKSGMKKRF